MTFYHGTTKEKWNKIQQDGVLWGRRYILNNDGSIKQEVSRCTYLAIDLDEAKQYGDTILKVEYNPFKHSSKNNYCEGCWQLRVYEPIDISSIKIVDVEQAMKGE